jgi:hypothetical protein
MINYCLDFGLVKLKKTIYLEFFFFSALILLLKSEVYTK